MPEAVQERELKEIDVETQLREKLEAEYAARRDELEAEYTKKLESQVADIAKKMQEDNQKVVQEAIERFRKEMGPPSQEDIQKLLEQDYLEFKVEVVDKGEHRAFTLKELPHAVEKRIFMRVKKIMVPFAADLAAISVNLLEGDAAKKLVDMMNTFEPLLEVLVATCTVCLNPFGDEKDITEEWVASHISSTRIVQIILAQAQCNRIRDFFSLIFSGSKMMATTR